MRRRLIPVAPPFAPEIERAFESYPRRDGYLLTLFRVFANSLRFVKKGTVNLLDRESPLAGRQREIVILRVTANNDCEYEWGVHVAAFATRVGLGERAVAATRNPGIAPGIWSAEEAVLIRVVDELCSAGTLTEATLAAFEETFDLAEQLEVLSLAGNYHTISFVANVARLPPEPFAARFPPVPAAGDQGLPEITTSSR